MADITRLDMDALAAAQALNEPVPPIVSDPVVPGVTPRVVGLVIASTPPCATPARYGASRRALRL
jgi:hypothetical protein